MTVEILEGCEIDIREVIANSPVASLPNAEAIMRERLAKSTEVRFGFVDDRLVCVWGLEPPTLISCCAWLWLLCTNNLAGHEFLFIRNSQRWMESALRRWPFIRGDVLVGNRAAQRWLRWLGAEFAEVDNGRIPFLIRSR